jgi:hypothetical protein
MWCDRTHSQSQPNSGWDWRVLSERISKQDKLLSLRDVVAHPRFAWHGKGLSHCKGDKLCRRHVALGDAAGEEEV